MSCERTINTIIDNMDKPIFLKMIALISVFLAPIMPVIIALLILVLINFVTGIWASVCKGLDRWSWVKFKGGLPKFILYPLGIVAGYLIELYIFDDIAFTKIASSIIALYEIKSIYTNIGDVTGMNLWTAIKKMAANTKMKGTTDILDGSDTNTDKIQSKCTNPNCKCK